MSIQEYFRPKDLYKELIVLDTINKDISVTQRELAKKANIAVAVLHDFLNKLEEKGLIIKKYLSTKTLLYIITDLGKDRLATLKIDYFDSVDLLLRDTQDSILEFFKSLRDKGVKKVFCYGAGSVSETIFNLLKNRVCEVEILGIIDDDTDKQGMYIGDYQIYSYDVLFNVKHTGIVVFSYSDKDKIREKLVNMRYKEDKIYYYF